MMLSTWQEPQTVARSSCTLPPTPQRFVQRHLQAPQIPGLLAVPGGKQIYSRRAQSVNSATKVNTSKLQQIHVRKATSEDAAAMAATVKLCEGYWSSEELAVECTEERTVLLVAEAKDLPEAVVGVVLVWCIADEAQIMEIAVHPDRQGQGIGFQLLREAISVSSRKIKERAGRGGAVLEVMVGNEPAISLYLKLGFKKTGYRRKYYPDGSDAILMRLPIS